jgi:peptidoglycan/LPS O-acetylase OafA/YrhL
MASREYHPALDGIRALALIAVVAYHMSYIPGGHLAVDVFFSLSGFLITSILLRQPRIDFRRFYLRRAVRILPALLLLLVGLLAFTSPHGRYRPWKASLYLLFYASNWVRAFNRGPASIALGPVNHGWSLSVEEHFYLVWPLLLWLLLRTKWSRPRVVLAVIALAVASAAWCAWLTLDTHSPRIIPYVRAYNGSDSRAQALFVGCAFAMVWSWNLLRWPARQAPLLQASALFALLAIGWLMLDTAGASAAENFWGLFFLVALLTAFSVHVLVTWPDGWLAKLLGLAPLALLGRISYGFYLWHYVVWSGIKLRLPEVPERWLDLASLPLTFAIAFASYYVVERPLMRTFRSALTVEGHEAFAPHTRS